MASKRNIYGPPGTGKTTKCIEQLQEWLNRGIDSHRIGYFSHTKVAAEEALHRAVKGTAQEASDFPWVRTLHSAAYGLLGLRRPQVVSNENGNLPEFMDRIKIPYNRYATQDDLEEEASGNREGNVVIQLWDFGRNRLHTTAEAVWDAAPNSLRDRTDLDTFRYFVQQYEGWKKRDSLYDFADMLLQVVARGLTPGCSHLIQDEVQDATPLQWQMMGMWEDDAEELVRAGDDDQGIYRFAGAVPDLFVNADGDRTVLAQSYRVPRSIHTEAQGIIERNHLRVVKQYLPRDAEGRFIRQYETVIPVPPATGTLAYLFRNRKHLSAFADELMREGTPFRSNRLKTPLTKPETAKGVRGLIEWCETGKTTIENAIAALTIILSTPTGDYYAFKEAKRNMTRLAESRPFREVDDIGLTPEGKNLAKRDPFLLFDSAKGWKVGHLDYLDRIIRKYGMAGLTGIPRTFLSTVHGVKGAEFDHVYISQDAVPNCQDGLAEDEETENRLKYVAVTRAKETCTILPPAAEGGWAL